LHRFQIAQQLAGIAVCLLIGLLLLSFDE